MTRDMRASGGVPFRRVRASVQRVYGHARSSTAASVQRVYGRARSSTAALVQLPASVLLLAVAVGLPLVTFAAAYAVSDRVTGGDIWRRKGYFLSAAIDTPPASNFGSLGLTVALMAFTCVALVRHHIVAERLKEQIGAMEALGSLHTASLVAALTAGLRPWRCRLSTPRGPSVAQPLCSVLCAVRAPALWARVCSRGARRAFVPLHSRLPSDSGLHRVLFVCHFHHARGRRGDASDRDRYREVARRLDGDLHLSHLPTLPCVVLPILP